MPLDLMTRADFRPTTLDRKARTVEVILSTGAPVQRFGYDGPFTEQLDVRAEAVDVSRLPVSLLDGHRQDGVASILGTLLSVRFEPRQMVGTLRISARHDALLDDIEAGDIRSVSIGYTIESYEERPGPKGQKVRTATRWTLVEASFVPVPADPLATVRSQNMTTTNPAAQAVTTPPAPVLQSRAETDAEIRALFLSQNLRADQADILVNSGATVEQARAAAQWALTQRQAQPTQRVTAMHQIDAPEAINTRMGEAMYARATGAKPSDAARPYMGLTVLDMARDCLTRAGANFTGLSGADVITRSLHTTSDFAVIFGDTMNRVLRTGYDAAPAALKSAAKQTTAKDFRTKTVANFGEAPTLEKVNEAGEFKSGTMADAKESYKIDTFGKIIGWSRQAMINDDLGALTDMGGKWGRAAADFEAQFLVNLLELNSGAGPVMDDTVQLFNAASHFNRPASGAAISLTTASVARLAMRKQKGLAGRAINVPPKFLIVPPDQETLAEQFLATLNPTATADVNPFGGKLELLVEARLSNATRWYIAADPAVIDGLEYAYLQGEEGPQVETKAGFEVDGMQFKVRLDFGAAFLDWRSWYMNPGV